MPEKPQIGNFKIAHAHVWRDIPGRKDEDKIWTTDKQPVLYLEDLHEDPADSIEKLMGVWGGWAGGGGARVLSAAR
jgi:hypothetical protein